MASCTFWKSIWFPMHFGKKDMTSCAFWKKIWLPVYFGKKIWFPVHLEKRFDFLCILEKNRYDFLCILNFLCILEKDRTSLKIFLWKKWAAVPILHAHYTCSSLNCYFLSKTTVFDRGLSVKWYWRLEYHYL